MINIKDRIENNFLESLEIHAKGKELLTALTVNACLAIVETLVQGNKVLCCGNGGSAATSQHFVAELINRFEVDRPSLPAIALTTDTSTITSIANDFSFDEIFSKQISALGRQDDCLVVISTSGNSKNILNAINVAHRLDLKVIALTGQDGGLMSKVLKKQDIEIRIPSQRTCRIQEMHELIIHSICDGVDYYLFNHEV